MDSGENFINNATLHWTNGTRTYLLPMTVVYGNTSASLNKTGLTSQNYSYYVSSNDTTYPDSEYVETSVVWTNLAEMTTPASIAEASTATGNFCMNNTWINPTDIDFNHTWFRYANGTTYCNQSSTTTFLNISYPHGYVQNLSAKTVDTSGNINNTLVWFDTTVSTIIYPNPVTNMACSTGNFHINRSLQAVQP